MTSEIDPRPARSEQMLPTDFDTRPRNAPDPFGSLEKITLLHVGVFVIGAAWAFGGSEERVGTMLSCWGSLGLIISARAIRTGAALRPLRWLWPLALFNALVLASVFNPNYREVADGAISWFVADPHLPRWPALPSTARPDLSLHALWFFDAVYLSCLNLALVVRQRRALRLLLLVLATNALVLAVFGTIQKLIGAPGLYFGLVETPQPYFFASFVYHNHWGAFTLLMTALTLGLVFHSSRHRRFRDFWHSPALLGMLSVVFLAVTIPLSTSRSCSVAVAVLLAGAAIHGLVRLIRRRRTYHESIALPLAGGVIACLIAAAFIFEFSRQIIAVRLDHTRDQLANMHSKGEYMPRAVLYRDTWNMAREKLWFGWGMAAYPTAFYTRNTQFESSNGPNRVYQDAHSDWLQSVTEVGLVGTALLGLCGLVPWFDRRRRKSPTPLVRYLLAGCGFVLLYAWLEFPFGSRAVVIAFWVCFFCAIHYPRLDSTPNATANEPR